MKMELKSSVFSSYRQYINKPFSLYNYLMLYIKNYGFQYIVLLRKKLFLSKRRKLSSFLIKIKLRQLKFIAGLWISPGTKIANVFLHHSCIRYSY